MSALDLITKTRRMRAIRDERRAKQVRRPLLTDVPALPRLLEYIPRLQPKYTSPEHLRPLAELFERARRERVLAVVSMPPRHGKTEAELTAIAWTLADDPAMQIAFIGYAARFAEKKSRKARELARRAGVPLADDSASRQDWRTGVEDGGLWATSIGGQITGEGFHLMIVDDPVKDRATAESATKRDWLYDQFNDNLFTRLEPTGSCIVTQTRWHEDDLGGRLIRDGWERINLPAINDGSDPRRDVGAPLWPERWSLDALAPIRERLGGDNGYGWCSLYQGNPRKKGGALFGDAHFYEAGALPRTGFRLSIGLDFAYTTKKHADWSVAVVMLECEGKVYVLDVVRVQAKSDIFAAHIQKLVAHHPGATARAYVSGTELGVLAMMAAEPYRLSIAALPAREDKFTRAQAFAAAWNAGKVLLPQRAPWLDAYLSEVKGFTGVGDLYDDQIDGSVSAFAPFAPSAAAPGLYDLDDFQKAMPPPRFAPSPASGWDDD